jgi:hypothetical protein
MAMPQLEELEEHLVRLGRPVAPLLLPGVGSAEIEATLGGAVPTAVAEWFAWHNGARTEDGQIQDDVNVIPGYGPLSVAEAVLLKRSYDDDPKLGPNWVPLLSTAGADIYAAVWDSATSEKIAGVLIGEPTEYEFGSIEQMLTVFNACYRREAYFVNDQRRLEMDPDAYEEIYSEIVGENPN